VRVLLGLEDLGGEVVHRLRLEVALGLRTAGRRLELRGQGLVAALRREVVGDHDDRPAAEGELAGQGFAAVLERGCGRVDAARGVRQGRLAADLGDADGRGGVAPGPVGEGDPLGVVEERLADVAARLAAVRLVGRVDRTPRVAGTAGRLDGLDQLRQGQVRGDRAVVGGAAVVL